MKNDEATRLAWQLAAGSLVALGFAVAALVRVENRLYAMETGLCKQLPAVPLATARCLQHVETRTADVWHVWYGVRRLFEDKLPEEKPAQGYSGGLDPAFERQITEELERRARQAEPPKK